MYEEFFKQTTEYIKQLVSDEYEVFASENIKNNGVVLHGISIRNKNERLSPVFYLDGYVGIEPKAAAQQIVQKYREVKEQEVPFNIDMLTDFNQVKDMICYKVINKDANEELLQDVPYDEIAGDLCAIYYLDIGNDASITIRTGMLDLWGISADKLYDYADVNTQRLHPATFRSMAETMIDIMSGGNLMEMKMQFGKMNLSDDEFKREIVKELDKDNPIPIYVLQGDGAFGASVLLYDNVMSEVREHFNGNYFILPSSISELLVVKDDGVIDVRTLQEMVLEVNEIEVSETERLSDTVYYCNEKGIIAVDDNFVQARTSREVDVR